MDIKEKIITDVLITEGWDKCTEDPIDRGGLTKWGITQHTATAAGFVGSVQHMTKEEAMHLYNVLFYRRLKIADLSFIDHILAFQVYDFGVNSGVNRAAKNLQKILNLLNDDEKLYPDLKQDGILGSRTLKTISVLCSKRKNVINLLNHKYYAERDAFYNNLAAKDKTQQRFLYGWSRRALDALNWVPY